MTALTYLTCLEKLYKNIYSKEYYFIKQGLCKLETKEAEVAKMGSNPTVVETAYTSVVESLSLVVHPLLLANPFAFNLSFFQLPDLLFYNIF